MKIEVKELEKNRVRIEIEVPSEEISKERENIYNALKPRAKIPGFRPGKTPEHLLERYFEEEVKKEIIKKLLPSYLQQAMVEKNLTPLTSPRLEDLKFASDGCLQIKASLETRPEIKMGKYKGIRLKKQFIQVKEEEINDRLMQLRQQLASFSSVEGRDEVKEGDYLIIDFQGLLKGKPLKGWSRKNFFADAGKDLLVPGFREKLIGMKKNREGEIEVRMPADYPLPALREQNISFKVTVKEIKEKTIPALDDSLAQDLGLASLGQVKEKLKEELIKQKEAEEGKRLLDCLIDKILEQTAIDVPSTLIESQKQSLLEELSNDFKRRGIDLEEYLQNKPEEKSNLAQRYNLLAEKQLKFILICGEIARKEGIKVEKEDIEKETEKRAARQGKNPEELKRELEKKKLMDNLQDDILKNKVLDFLFRQAKIKVTRPSIFAGLLKIFKK